MSLENPTPEDLERWRKLGEWATNPDNWADKSILPVKAKPEFTVPQVFYNLAVWLAVSFILIKLGVL